MLSNHVSDGLQLRFRHPLLVEVSGDQSHLDGPAYEVVDVFDCPHRKKTFTVLHVPHGSMPTGITAAEPVDYEDYE